MVVVRNLESCVEELRADVVSGKSQVVLADVDAMVLALGHIGRSLASLRGTAQQSTAAASWRATVATPGEWQCKTGGVRTETCRYG